MFFPRFDPCPFLAKMLVQRKLSIHVTLSIMSICQDEMLRTSPFISCTCLTSHNANLAVGTFLKINIVQIRPPWPQAYQRCRAFREVHKGAQQRPSCHDRCCWFHRSGACQPEGHLRALAFRICSVNFALTCNCTLYNIVSVDQAGS